MKHQHAWKITHHHTTKNLISLRCKRCPATATAEVLVTPSRETIDNWLHAETVKVLTNGSPSKS